LVVAALPEIWLRGYDAAIAASITVTTALGPELNIDTHAGTSATWGCPDLTRTAQYSRC